MGEAGTKPEFDKVVRSLSTKGTFAELLRYDQLNNERREKNVFAEFMEGEITFLPTYRMEYGKKGRYNNKKNQSPSWTDRILWKDNSGTRTQLVQQYYTCAEDVIWSDHRPVRAAFEVRYSCAHDLGNIQLTSSYSAPTSFVYSLVDVDYFTSTRQTHDDHQLAGEPIGQMILGFTKGEHMTDAPDAKVLKAFPRYVLYGEAPAEGKVLMRIHDKFMEASVTSTATSGKEMLPTAIHSSLQVDSSSYLKFHWSSDDIPPLHSCAEEVGMASKRTLLVSLHTDLNPPQVLGFAKVTLQEFDHANKVHFVAPVLLNGQPAGLLCGAVEKSTRKCTPPSSPRSAGRHLVRAAHIYAACARAGAWRGQRSKESASEDKGSEVVKATTAQDIPVYTHARLVQRKTSPLDKVDTARLEVSGNHVCYSFSLKGHSLTFVR